MPIDATAVARVTGLKTQYQDMREGRALFLPQHIALFGQGSSSVAYSTEKFIATSHQQVGRKVGWGSPLHLAAMELLPDNGDGIGTVTLTVFPLEDAYEGTPSQGKITPTGVQAKAGQYRVRVAGYLSTRFVIAESESIQDICTKIADAINGVLHMPVIATAGATDVDLVSKWAGESANDITIEVLGEPQGVDFAITNMTGGLANPSLAGALAQIGPVWVTMGLNCLNIEDTDALDEIQEFGGEPGTETTPGSGRWDPLVRKPLVVFVGNTKTDPTAATVEVVDRPTDCVNVQLVAPGSPNLPCVVAARQLARIARLANNNPPHDYGSQRATGLIPGADGDQWNYAQRDLAVKRGSSTVEVRNGEVAISDVVTPYRPDGDPLPPYRFVADIVKLQNVIFNFDIEFTKPEWDGAPLLPDDEPTTNATAKKPKMAKSVAGKIIDGLADAAILVNREASKKSVATAIDPQNPKRLNMTAPVQLSGNANQKAITLHWGFLFG